MNFSGKTYWLVGASEGLGRAIAQSLHAEGADLILSARNQSELESLANELGRARALAIDVTDQASLEAARASVTKIDGLVYCAGTYHPMSALEWDSQKALQIVDVNFLGAIRILGLVLPEMIERNQGHVVLIGSLASYQGLPGAIGYGASKAALVHLAENLYCDLQDTKIKVQVINPGYIETQLTDKNDFKMPQIMNPNEAAERCLKIMKSKKFKAAFPAPFKWFFVLGRFLPYKLYAWFFRR